MTIMAQRGRVLVLDDDSDLGASIARMLAREGWQAEAFDRAAAMLGVLADGGADCLVTDMMMDGDDGFAVARAARAIDGEIAILFMTGWPSTSDAVDAIRRLDGTDYLEKPVDPERLLASVGEGVERTRARRRRSGRFGQFTRREREVFDHLMRGMSSKAIAKALGISPRTVDDHRAAIMKKSGASGLADLFAWAQGHAPGGGPRAADDQ